MTMPPPPGMPTPKKEETLGDITPPKIIKELTADEEGKLTDAEYSFILETTLRTKNREEPKVLAFIDAFIRTRSVNDAAAEIGVAKSVAYSWRNQRDIALAIQRLTDKSMIKYGFDASEVIERTKEVMDFDPIELTNADGTFKTKMSEIDPAARRVIKKFEAKNLWKEVEDVNGVKTTVWAGELIKVEFYDKLKAAEMVGKEKNLFKNTSVVEHTVSANMADILLSASRRGAAASEQTVKRLRDVNGEVVE